VKKKLSTFDVFCLGVNAIIGSGIFLMPGILAREAGPASIAAFLVCGMLLISVALCYAELGGMYSRNGGSYVYAKEAFGPVPGYAVGWMAWVTAIFSWAAVANAVSSYLEYFHPLFGTLVVRKGMAAALIVIFGVINYRGIKLGALTVNIFTISKLAPLVLFIALGFPHVSMSHYHPFWSSGTGTFGYAVFLSLWSLQGFETTPLPAGESRSPKQAVPIAAVGSLLFSTVMYVLIQAVAVGVYSNLSGSLSKPLADASLIFLGAAGAGIMSLGAVISMTGYNAGNALGSPRFLSAMAEDRFLPEVLAAPHPRFHTPFRAILLTTALTLVAALFLNFESLVNVSNFTVIVQYVATCGALVWLRHKKPLAPRAFKSPFGTAVGVIGCAVSLWLIRQVKAQEFILSCVVLIVGFVLLGLFRRRAA
jgi:APA family basic amino acid/polyamine antiporter